MAFVNYLSQNLAWLMSEKRLSANQLGRNLQMPAITIHKLKSGEQKNPTVETLHPIATYFDVTIHELMCDNLKLRNKPHTGKTNVIPMITWEDVLSWSPDKLVSNAIKFISTDYPSSEQTYCFVHNHDNTSIFEKGALLIVDALLKPQNRDYVIVTHKQNGSASIKKVIIDDEVFLQSLNVDLNNTITFNYDDYLVIGVIVGYIKYFRNV